LVNGARPDTPLALKSRTILKIISGFRTYLPKPAGLMTLEMGSSSRPRIGDHRPSCITASIGLIRRSAEWIPFPPDEALGISREFHS
jgi:hypothetical protein